MYRLARATAALAILCAPAAAQEPRADNSLFVFGGSLMKGPFPGWTLVPYAGGVEGNHLVGAAYRRRVADFAFGFNLGGEVGLAARFGDRASGEIWGGASFGHRGLVLGPITVAPAVVVGLSAVTGSIGIERVREFEVNGDATLLFYLGPELSFRHESFPNVELVLRTHHRSGLKKTLGRMGEGANANIVGLRFGF